MSDPGFLDAIQRMFRGTAVVIISGIWQSGKTDIALLIALLLKRMGVVQRIATNIEVEHPDIEYIYSIAELRKWLKSDSSEKIYILDEAGEHAFLRDAATKLNKALGKLMPQLSKGHGRIVLVTQTPELMDYILQLKTWVRGRIYKPSDVNLGETRIMSDRVPGGVMDCQVPSVRKVFGVNFNRYGSAPLVLEEENEKQVEFKDEDLNTLQRWAAGESYKTLGMHPQEMNRLLRKIAKKYLKLMKETREKQEKEGIHTSQDTVVEE